MRRGTNRQPHTSKACYKSSYVR